jgi:ubiquinol-cytochrome c reductase subunit 7
LFFLGLRYDDLIAEREKDVWEALELLPKEELYARHYRLKRAFQLSLMHRILPEKEWTTPEQDVRYLRPWIEQVRKEREERESYDYPAKKRPFSMSISQ